MGAHGDALALESGQSHGTCGHQTCGDTTRKMTAAAGILISVILHLGGVVGVAGTGNITHGGIVTAAGVGILDQKGDGRTRGLALKHTADDAHEVRLGAGGGQHGVGGATEVHLMGDKSLVHRDTGCHAVQDGTDHLTVALPEQGDGYVVAKCVFHGCFFMGTFLKEGSHTLQELFIKMFYRYEIYSERYIPRHRIVLIGIFKNAWASLKTLSLNERRAIC